MNLFDEFLSSALAQKLGWVFLHFLWQGAGIALLLAATLFFGPRQARERYLASCMALLGMVIAPIATFLWIELPTAASLLPYDAGALALSDPGPVEGSSVPAVLTLFWFLGAILQELRMLRGWWRAQELRRKSLRPLGEPWESAVEAMRSSLDIRVPVRVAESALARVPTVIGWLSPVVLVPGSALLSLNPEQLRMVLAHELAHIRRHDYLVNLIQTIVEAILFFHPAVWWVSRRLRVEREFCCDDIAVDLGGNALGYARALERLETLRCKETELAMASTGGSLMHRIQRLVAPERTTSGRFTLGLVPIALLLSAFLSTAAFGFSRQSASESSWTQDDGELEQRISELRREIDALERRIDELRREESHEPRFRVRRGSERREGVDHEEREFVEKIHEHLEKSVDDIQVWVDEGSGPRRVEIRLPEGKNRRIDADELHRHNRERIHERHGEDQERFEFKWRERDDDHDVRSHHEEHDGLDHDVHVEFRGHGIDADKLHNEIVDGLKGRVWVFEDRDGAKDKDVRVRVAPKGRHGNDFRFEGTPEEFHERVRVRVNGKDLDIEELENIELNELHPGTFKVRIPELDFGEVHEGKLEHLELLKSGNFKLMGPELDGKLRELNIELPEAFDFEMPDMGKFHVLMKDLDAELPQLLELHELDSGAFLELESLDANDFELRSFKPHRIELRRRRGDGDDGDDGEAEIHVEVRAHGDGEAEHDLDIEELEEIHEEHQSRERQHGEHGSGHRIHRRESGRDAIIG